MEEKIYRTAYAAKRRQRSVSPIAVEPDFETGGDVTSGVLVCGILGLLLHDTTNDAAQEICEGLSLLQHRGQDACGIVTCGHKGRLYQCKANGMVRDVFDKKAVARLIGSMGIGHGILSFPTKWGRPILT